MKTSFLQRLAALALPGALLLPADRTVAQDCPAPASWFPHSQTPKPDFGKPADDCAFYQWSWQEFLYLTQPADKSNPRGSLRFMTYKSPQEVFSPTLAKTLAARSKKAPLILHAHFSQLRGNEKGTVVADTTQATGNPLVDPHTGRAVYYSQHVSPEWVHSVTSMRLTGTNGVQQFNRIFSTNGTTTNAFEVGAVELKAAWRIVTPNDIFPTNLFYTTTAEVENLMVNPQNPATLIPAGSNFTAQVALVGLHVVGVVAGHPEFIWATFEHRLNAPLLTNSTLSCPSNLVFYVANTAAANCNIAATTNNLKINATSQIVSPVNNVCFPNAQALPAGNVTTNDQQNIAAINASVAAQLQGVFTNYLAIGAVWGAQYTAPYLYTNMPLAGALNLANTTMETFGQGVNPPPPYNYDNGNVLNCFGCHSSSSTQKLNPSMMNVSHALTGNIRSTK